MDELFKNMDIIVRHWGAFPRRFPSPCPVRTIGDLPFKDSWIDRSFSTANFSLILSGRGEFRRMGRLWPVEAPCVITQWPGEMLHYGPAPLATWHEVYFMYDASRLPWLRRRGFVDVSRPVWPICNPSTVLSLVGELRALLLDGHPEALVDRVDCLCERIILETLLSPSPSSGTPIDRIIDRMRRQLHLPWDFHALAQSHGMSPSTFRRRWFEATRESPGRSLLNMRIQQACRLLAETSLSINEIASRTGFTDALYFSRRFKIETRLSPSHYRRLNAPATLPSSRT